MVDECDFYYDTNYYLLKIEMYSVLDNDDIEVISGIVEQFDNFLFDGDATIDLAIDTISRETAKAILPYSAKIYPNGITTIRIKTKNQDPSILESIGTILKMTWAIIDYNFKVHEIEFIGDLS